MLRALAKQLQQVRMEAMDVDDVGCWLHEQGFSDEVIDSFSGKPAIW